MKTYTININAFEMTPNVDEEEVQQAVNILYQESVETEGCFENAAIEFFSNSLGLCGQNLNHPHMHKALAVMATVGFTEINFILIDDRVESGYGINSEVFDAWVENAKAPLEALDKFEVA